MEKESVLITSRNVSLDLLRICATVMVVMLHISSANWHSANPNSYQWVAMNIYDSLCRSAVPLFFMLSGAFVLKKDIPLKQLYLNKVLPLVIIYFAWSFLYAVDKIGMAKMISTDASVIVQTIIKSQYHLWFIPTLIGLYMLQPVLHAIVKYNEGACIKYLLILFTVFGIVRHTIILFVTDSSVKTLIGKIPIELMGYSAYMVLGHFLVNIIKHKFKPLFMFAGFILVVMISAIVCQLDAIFKGSPSEILYDYFTVTTFMEAILLFLCFHNFKVSYSPKLQILLQKLSALTIGVYLLHPFVIDQLNSKLHLTSTTYNTFVAIPINTILITTICFSVTFIMTKIPILNRLWKY